MRKLMSSVILSSATLLLLMAACGRDNRSAEATAAPPPAAQATVAAPAAPTVEPTAAPTDLPAEMPAMVLSDDPTRAVASAMAAQVAGGPYRATTVIESEGTTTEMISEVIPPNRIRVVIGGGNMEMILLEDVLWSKMGGAEWTQMGSPEMMQGIFDTIQGQVSGTELANVQLVGSEPVFGEATDIYSFSTTLSEGGFTSEVKLWISKATGLPVRMESTSISNGVTTTAVQTIEYDDSITIEAPVQ